MYTTQLNCDLCLRDIAFGAPYVAILYNIESVERNHIHRQDEIQVVSSDQIITMCGSCGNKRSAEKVTQLLKTTLNLEDGRLN